MTHLVRRGMTYRKSQCKEARAELDDNNDGNGVHGLVRGHRHFSIFTHKLANTRPTLGKLSPIGSVPAVQWETPCAKLPLLWHDKAQVYTLLNVSSAVQFSPCAVGTVQCRYSLLAAIEVHWPGNHCLVSHFMPNDLIYLSPDFLS